MDADREKVLRERAQGLVGVINAGECDGERILAALHQTAEEERAAYVSYYSQAMDHLGESGCEPNCWVV